MAKILTSSDCSLCVEFGNAISEDINRQVRSFTVAAEAAHIKGVTELVPTYRSVTVHYRPEIIGYARLYEKLNNIVNGLKEAEIPPAGEIRVPVLYGGSHGPDLENVARLHDMTPEEVIALHTAPTFLHWRSEQRSFSSGKPSKSVSRPQRSPLPAQPTPHCGWGSKWVLWRGPTPAPSSHSTPGLLALTTQDRDPSRSRTQSAFSARARASSSRAAFS